MLDIEYTRLIAAAVAAFLLGWTLYIAAYTKHKNAIRDEENKRLLNLKDSGLTPQSGLVQEYRIEKTASWYMGYRLALLGLIVSSTAIGWAVGWIVGQEHVLTWVEDAAAAVAGALIGGLLLDKHVIHPLADGSFFEKVEDPLVQRFLSDAVDDPVQVKKSVFSFLKRKKKKQDEEVLPEAPAEEAPAAGIEGMSFEEKIKLLELLKKSL